MARTRRGNQYGFFPDPGTNYSYGQEPELARRLNRLGKSLKLRLEGISGYRSPAHSVSVGGFSDDPHTRGQASDTPGVESVPESTLNRFGLTRPFPGAQEADHIQIFGARGGSATPRGGTRNYTLADYWTQANPTQKNFAPIMAAIGMAESGGRIDATHTNSDGTTDDGWLQINSSHGYDRNRLRTDPVYCARAGGAILRSQGLTAWTTYQTGAFRAFMGTGKNFIPRAGRVRPGGEAPMPGEADGLDSMFEGYTQDVGWHLSPLVPFPLPFKLPGPGLDIPVPNPLDMFKDVKKGIKGTADFLALLGWILHPRHILQAIEFVTGLTIMGFGLHTLMAVYKDTPQTGAAPRATQATRRVVREAVTMTPPGRAARTARAAQFGKRKVRAKTRETESQAAARRGERSERKRQAKKSNAREKRRARFSREDVPF